MSDVTAMVSLDPSCVRVTVDATTVHVVARYGRHVVADYSAEYARDPERMRRTALTELERAVQHSLEQER